MLSDRSTVDSSTVDGGEVNGDVDVGGPVPPGAMMREEQDQEVRDDVTPTSNVGHTVILGLLFHFVLACHGPHYLVAALTGFCGGRT